MVGFEPLISGVRGDRSTCCAMTPALDELISSIPILGEEE